MRADVDGQGAPVPATAGHLVRLPGTRWRLWREACVRSAGFPVGALAGVSDDHLAAAADRHAETPSPATSAAYQTAYQHGTRRLSAAVRELAATPRFREAIAWQNPALVPNCLDKLVAGERRNVRGRNHELALVSYLQRYCLKNDTVGFFGPVGWARLAIGGPALSATAGRTLLARRSCYFEVWAIDELARTLAGWPELAPWLCPRPAGGDILIDTTLYRPLAAPVPLPDLDAQVFAQCDGSRTVSDIVAALPTAGAEPAAGGVTEALARLRALGAIAIDLPVPIDSHPERALRTALARVTDPALRARALAPLDALVGARDAVAAAAGDAAAVAKAGDALAETFQRITGTAPTRRPGRAYAGRTLVYEDCVRDFDATIGAPVLAALAAPLALVLDSARWLVSTVGDRYHQIFLDLYERECSRSGAETVPLARLTLLAMPHLPVPSTDRLVEPVRRAREQLRQRWQEVLRTPTGVRRHQVAAADLADAVAHQFAAAAPGWSAATEHSPDLMIAAPDPAAVARGDFLLVLGELHVAVNTLESRLFVAQHPDASRLLAAAEADHGDRRVYAVPRKSSPVVSSRVSPPSALLSPRYTYWTAGDDAIRPPGPVLPAADLLVYRHGDQLMVRSRSTGRRYPFLEVIGETLTGTVGRAFQPSPPAPHTPRVTIDKLVLFREAWTLPARAAEWAFVRDESARYLGARQWRRRHGIPERAFYSIAEEKPVAVDFRSLALVNLLAKAIRRTADETPGSFRITEILPDLHQLWLADADGQRYTSELRLIATEAGTGGSRPG